MSFLDSPKASSFSVYVDENRVENKKNFFSFFHRVQQAKNPYIHNSAVLEKMCIYAHKCIRVVLKP